MRSAVPPSPRRKRGQHRPAESPRLVAVAPRGLGSWIRSRVGELLICQSRSSAQRLTRTCASRQPARACGGEGASLHTEYGSLPSFVPLFPSLRQLPTKRGNTRSRRGEGRSEDASGLQPERERRQQALLSEQRAPSSLGALLSSHSELTYRRTFRQGETHEEEAQKSPPPPGPCPGLRRGHPAATGPFGRPILLHAPTDRGLQRSGRHHQLPDRYLPLPVLEAAPPPTQGGHAGPP